MGNSLGKVGKRHHVPTDETVSKPGKSRSAKKSPQTTGGSTGYKEGQRPAADFSLPPRQPKATLFKPKGPKATNFLANPPEDAPRDPKKIESVLKEIKVKYLGNGVVPVRGRVEARFTIDTDGKVKDVVLSGSPFSGDIDGTDEKYVKKSLCWTIEHLKFDPAGSEDHIRTSFRYQE